MNISRLFFSYLTLPKRYNTVFIRFVTNPAKRRTDQFILLKEKLISNSAGFSPEFINDVRNNVFEAGDRINPQNFNSLFMDTCIHNNLFELGRTFFHYCNEENDSVNLALISKYFRFCYHFNNLCLESDKKYLIILFDKIIRDYPILDEYSCESLSMGLSITERWRDCLKLLEMCKEYGNPTNLMCSSIIKAAFYNGDQKLGWILLDEIIQKGAKPHASVYSSILETSEESVKDLLKFLEKYNLYIPDETASLIQKNKTGSFTTITHNGFCRNCKNQLSKININDEEFKKLTEDFLNPVLIGKNIFIKTQPSELDRFKKFLDNSRNTNVVLDGLNIAYAANRKTSPYNQSKLLMDVVNHFVKKDLNVMVLGREHMRRWTKTHMKTVINNCYTFFAEDLSCDDPYLLYATMFYGLGTKFVSRDLMRGHKYLLKTLEMKRTFSRWQQKHQLFLTYVEKNGFVHLKDVGSYLISSQCNNGVWHIPIHEPNQAGVQPHIQALNMKWLCIKS